MKRPIGIRRRFGRTIGVLMLAGVPLLATMQPVAAGSVGQQLSMFNDYPPAIGLMYQACAVGDNQNNTIVSNCWGSPSYGAWNAMPNWWWYGLVDVHELSCPTTAGCNSTQSDCFLSVPAGQTTGDWWYFWASCGYQGPAQQAPPGSGVTSANRAAVLTVSLETAQCIRAHGYQVPDPPTSGGLWNMGVRPPTQQAAFLKVDDACFGQSIASAGK